MAHSIGKGNPAKHSDGISEANWPRMSPMATNGDEWTRRERRKSSNDSCPLVRFVAKLRQSPSIHCIMRYLQYRSFTKLIANPVAVTAKSRSSLTLKSATNDPDQRGPGDEHPFVRTDQRSYVASDGSPRSQVSGRENGLIAERSWRGKMACQAKIQEVNHGTGSSNGRPSQSARRVD